MIITIVVNFICCIAFIFIPESPDFLYGIKDFDSLRKSLNYISKFNGSDYRINQSFDIEEKMKAKEIKV
jgi:hypothetical protein